MERSFGPCVGSSNSNPCRAAAMLLLSCFAGTTNLIDCTEWRGRVPTKSHRRAALSVQSSNPPTASTADAIVATPANSPEN